MKKFCFDVPEDVKKEMEKTLNTNIYTSEDFSGAIMALINLIKIKGKKYD